MAPGKITKSIRWTIFLTLAINLIFLVKDISDDLAEGAGIWHIGPEIFIILGTVATAVLALAYFLKMKERAEGFERKVAVLESDNRNWQDRTRVFSLGLAQEIDRQLAAWQLSAAEKEIALLLLKGLSNREIAEIRSTSEHTIKQQSSAIYRKSGQASRSELSAFFLEDLLSPSPTAEHGQFPLRQ